GALVEQLGLLRVHVLAAQRIVLVQLARLEADDASARVGKREHQPPLERVHAAAGEPGGRELLAREALRLRFARERIAGQRVTEPELTRDLLAEAAALQVVPRERAGLGLPEHG